ncbi:MAG: response regulator [Elusimicrobia bacterium]|nr:response regulator [Elusimicrobiota bacterium]
MKKRILIAEDDMAIVELLKASLEDAGYEVSYALNGVDALEVALRGKTPDLIIIDVIMPRMNGFELCSMLQSNEKTSQIPKLICTAEGSLGDIDKGLSLGAVGYIVKPFDLEKVREKISHILRD